MIESCWNNEHILKQLGFLLQTLSKSSISPHIMKSCAWLSFVPHKVLTSKEFFCFCFDDLILQDDFMPSTFHQISMVYALWTNLTKFVVKQRELRLWWIFKTLTYKFNVQVEKYQTLLIASMGSRIPYYSWGSNNFWIVHNLSNIACSKVFGGHLFNEIDS